MTWQPIETAPKDGTWVDLWCGERDGYPAGRFENMSFRGGEWRHPSFFSHSDSYGTPLAAMPTHWMPLPEPPAPNE